MLPGRSHIPDFAIPQKFPDGDNAEKCNQINSEIGMLNDSLKAFARSERVVTYCDNTNILISDKQEAGEIKHYDNSYQLSEEGRCILHNNIKKALGEAVQISVMAGEWKTVKSDSSKTK